ncbi:TRAP transporter small permease [Phaeobacter sp. B1627]|uniref:TRAP transporter small permease n=1 Tax=Phaeobacter sp. B1627 TaxID=2583809 RepID=UPI00111B7E7F|nr:TRAP transporter small permease [Phaeobacter sp. B1627]TNJ41745.1 TRAP transporter small permease [Phaeobacter sp. B1627]
MRGAVDLVLKVVISAIFVTLVACVSWQVVSRYILGTPSTVTDELARFLFMWLALIGGAYTMGLRRHLAIDLLTQNLAGRARSASEGFTLFAIAGFATLVMIKGGGQLVMKTFASGQVTPALQIPMGYVYGAIPFAGAVILYYCAIFAFELWRDGPGSSDVGEAPQPLGGPLD